MDVWRLRTRPPALAVEDLIDMVSAVVDASLPNTAWRMVPSGHPYTTSGRQIDARADEAWLEVGECGLANPQLLTSCGLPVPPASGLAMGLGLDRILMLRKGIDDIRLLRSPDPRVATQMLDLSPYRRVSTMPPVRRDLSIAVRAEATPEDLGDRVRAALGPEATAVEVVEVLSETPRGDLPPAARERLGINPGQKNVLVRVVLRHLERTLTDDEANLLRDRVYAALHEGSVHAWARGRPPVER